MSGYGWCEMKTYTVEEGLNLAHGGKIREAAIYFCHAVKEEPHNPALYQRLREEQVICVQRGPGVRLSPHFYTSEQVIEETLSLLTQLAKG